MSAVVLKPKNPEAVNIHALIIERDHYKGKYIKLLGDISILEKERASTLKAIRLLNYKIEDGDQQSLLKEGE